MLNTILEAFQSETTWLVIFGTVAIAAHLAALFKVTWVSPVLQIVRKALDLIAGNYANAKNAAAIVDKIDAEVTAATASSASSSTAATS